MARAGTSPWLLKWCTPPRRKKQAADVIDGVYGQMHKSKDM